MLRRWRAIADSYDPPRMLVGETLRVDAERRSRRSTATATSCTSRSTSRSLHSPLRGRRDARRRRATRGAAARRTRGRCGRARNHDMSRFPTRWAERRSGRDPVRADDAAHAARDACSCTTATRSACPTPTCRDERLRRSGRRPLLRRTRAATRCARRCSGRPGRAPGSPRRRRAVAAVRRHRRVQRRGPAARPGLDALARAATSSALRAPFPTSAPAAYHAGRGRGRDVGAGGAASG